MEGTTADGIIGKIRNSVRAGNPIAPSEWLELAFDLNALIGEENDKYARMYREAHEVQVEEIGEGKTVSQAEATMKASVMYEDLLKQKGKVEQIMEFIRIAKIRGSQAEREFELNP